MNSKSYELVIIGGGPAGASAGVYAARKQIKTAIIADSFGGQSIESDDIQNWIGTKSITGINLAKSLKEHVKHYASSFVDIKEGERVELISGDTDNFEVKTNKDTYKTRTILIASGSSRKKLDIEGAKEFEGKGITYCASCDGPFFKDKEVVVIGGGNAGFESAMQLLAYCKKVTLISRGDFKADPVTIEKILLNHKFKAVPNAIPQKIIGDTMVKSLVYKTNSPFVVDEEIKADGIFVEIGHTPNTNFAKNILELDDFGRIIIDYKNQKTTKEGIWAAGDCSNILYHQNNIAAGDAVKALEDIYLSLRKK